MLNQIDLWYHVTKLKLKIHKIHKYIPFDYFISKVGPVCNVAGEEQEEGSDGCGDVPLRVDLFCFVRNPNGHESFRGDENHAP